MKGQLRIDTTFAFVVVDVDGTEGVPAIIAPDGTVWPMIGADEERIDSLRPMAVDAARILGRPIELVRFTNREHVEWIEG